MYFMYGVYIHRRIVEKTLESAVQRNNQKVFILTQEKVLIVINGRDSEGQDDPVHLHNILMTCYIR